MGDMLKNDPVLRTVVVVFVGLLIFGFLFGFNFGGGPGYSGGQGHHGGGQAVMGPTYFGSFIAGIISLLINVLLLVLVVALIAGAVVAVKKWLCEQQTSAQTCKAVELFNQDPVLRTSVLVLAGILLFYLAGAILGGFGSFGYAASPYFMIMGLIMLLTKLLVVALVVTLTVALLQYIKASANTGSDGQQETGSQEKTQPFQMAGNSGAEDDRA